MVARAYLAVAVAVELAEGGLGLAGGHARRPVLAVEQRVARRERVLARRARRLRRGDGGGGGGGDHRGTLAQAGAVGGDGFGGVELGRLDTVVWMATALDDGFHDVVDFVNELLSGKHSVAIEVSGQEVRSLFLEELVRKILAFDLTKYCLLGLALTLAKASKSPAHDLHSYQYQLLIHTLKLTHGR